MRKRFSGRNGPGNGRNQTLLLHRLKEENCKNYQRVEDVVKYLQSRYPDYKRMSVSVLTRSIEKALYQSKHNKSKRNDVDESCQDAEFRQSSSFNSVFELNSESESTGGQVSDPKFDMMKSMLREGYCHGGGMGGKNVQVLENEEEKVEEQEEQENPMKGAVMLEDVVHGGMGKKDSGQQQEQGREGRGRPMFKDFGGMGQVVEELIYDVLIPLCHPELLSRLRGLRAGPPTGILLHGPPGCGKTMLAQAIANEAGVPLYQVAATEFVSGVSGQSEENIRALFTKACKTSPSIIFIDEIDAIAEKRENSQKGMEGRIVTQLLKCMDSIQEGVSPEELGGSDNSNADARPGHVLVIGATNRPNSLDRALRRPGRFSREIKLGAPDENARFEILSVLTRHLGVQDGLDLKKLARDTQGFVGADLEECVSKACLLAVQKMINSKKSEGVKESALMLHVDNWWKQLQFTHGELETLIPTMADFEVAVKCVQPSLKREGFSAVPNVKWEDVGGLEKIRQLFQSSIIHPLKFPKDYEAVLKDLPAGFLLYGPPGCGKTLIAKAVANEAGASFIHIQGPELMDKYVGQSELAVRQIFSRARMCSPCILFFDEVDALTENHGESSGVTDRVLKQLLIELDGAEERHGVYVIGATNKPLSIDRALLRPGRFEELLYVPLPSPEERGLILKALGRRRSIDASVDLLALGKSEACEHFSGSDLSRLMRRASTIANQEMQSLKHMCSDVVPQCTINVSHFEKALVELTPSVNKEQIERYDRWSRRLSAA